MLLLHLLNKPSLQEKEAFKKSLVSAFGATSHGAPKVEVIMDEPEDVQPVTGKDIIPFPHDEFGTISGIQRGGEPWFIATEIAIALGYSNPHKAIRDHCKGVNETFIPTIGGIQTKNIIPESDLYRLIMRSKLEAAERFQDWVVEVVLPSIRKTGSYSHVKAEEVKPTPGITPEVITCIQAPLNHIRSKFSSILGHLCAFAFVAFFVFSISN